MSRIIGFILTPVFLFFFLGTLLLFHPLLVIAKTLFGYSAHKFVLEIMNRCIINELKLTGASFNLEFESPIPAGVPLIIVSNHQSMYDIPLFVINFRKHHPKFIAKRELAYGLPSISYALRAMGSAVIDRKDHKNAIDVIKSFAIKTSELGHSACIFPEGTRARDGKMKPFKTGGLITLIENMPGALVVPVTITGNWEILRYNFKPIPYGVKVRMKVFTPIDPKGRDVKELCSEIEGIIREGAGQGS